MSSAEKEYKFLDTTVNQSSISSSGTIAKASLVEIQQGQNESERIGRKVLLKYIECRYIILLPARVGVNPVPNGDIIRTIVYLDKQCNGAAAAVADIMEQQQENGLYNLTNVPGRFEILLDRTEPINYNTISKTSAGDFYSTGELYSYYKWSMDLLLPVLYNSPSTMSIADLASNNIGVLLISTDNNAQWTGFFRVRFSDT